MSNKKVVNFVELTYQKATAEDIEPIFAFNKELIDKYENIQNIEYDKVLSWVRRKIENNISEYSCVLCDGQKAGYFHFYPSEGMRELDDLYIFPEFQNQGIGTEIIKKCCTESETPVFLYVFIKNDKAVALYKRLGFKVVKTIDNSRYIMQKGENVPCFIWKEEV